MKLLLSLSALKGSREVESFFLYFGHVNITSGLGPIIIDENDRGGSRC